MLVIRLTKVGAKKRPFYRVVVIEHDAARDGAAVEILGYYDPRQQPERLEIDRERFAHWLGTGARPSDTVRTLLARHPAPAAAPAPAPAEPAVEPQPAPTDQGQQVAP
jgi:small subunit ribosomal protein S16